MKKALLAIGLSSALLFAGCADDEGQDVQEDQTNDNNDVTEVDENELKSSLLDTQMNLISELRVLNQTILEYDALLNGEEEPEEEALIAAAEEAKTAAEEALSKLESFEVSGTYTEEVQSSLEDSLEDLKTYFQERINALDESQTEPDFTAAQEAFDSFQEKFGSIFEEAGLLVPDMAKELS
ncbi:hypothetical protein EDD68_10378 [Melghiribacillus thermohalophilus]|uniref:Cell-wall binding lipoprotein n=1 Tax=Melghiribacillus thermohalophilus TaxID=1324956 RepID=A0A4R3NA79_9BACI|nr:hypothetical protein [Melghiribacillus thermohalophilus]TCT25524.1 hypothetical protein EDD68_10378 [Melghiribacillus thermohalophilus]